MSALPDFSEATARREAPASSSGRGWLLAGGLAFALTAAAALQQQADLDAARTDLAAARSAPIKPRARGREEERSQALLAQQRLSAAASPARVLAELQALQPRGVRLASVRLRYDQDVSVDLEVVARGAADYDRLLAALERSPRFADLTPGAENREGEVRSSLSVRYARIGP